jgi:hypothetical protein
LVLLLRPEERNAVPDGATAHPDGCRDEQVPEAANPVQRQSDADQLGPSAWDAWDGVRPDEAEDAELQSQFLPEDADAEKLAGRARGGRAQDASFPQDHSLEPAEAPDAAAELCKRDADQSAARSCEEQEAAAVPESRQVRLDAASRPASQARQQKL